MVFEKFCITTRTKVISIHALREEGDFTPTGGAIRMMIFLSTPSARRATTREIRRTKRQFYFYPRPPRGGRPSWQSSMQPSLYFYPRPPRGGRPAQLSPAQHPQHFYPRPPRGGRHSFQNPGVPPYEFLSTPSARRATCAAFPCPTPTTFLSTPSARRATQFPESRCPPIRISIHALREEGDPAFPRYSYPHPNFYPRPPRGGRRSPNTNNNNNV